jgi:hypothetical protein
VSIRYIFIFNVILICERAIRFISFIDKLINGSYFNPGNDIDCFLKNRLLICLLKSGSGHHKGIIQVGSRMTPLHHLFLEKIKRCVAELSYHSASRCRVISWNGGLK